MDVHIIGEAPAPGGQPRPHPVAPASAPRPAVHSAPAADSLQAERVLTRYLSREV